VKHITLLILIVLSVTTFWTEPVKAFSEQDSQTDITVLHEMMSTVQQELANQKKLLENQQAQIVALENSEITTKSELSVEMTALEQDVVKLRNSLIKTAGGLRTKITRAEQSIKKLKGIISELSDKGEQQSVLIEQQSAAIGTLQGALDEYKNSQDKLLRQQSERVGLLAETLKATRVEFTGRVENVKSGVSETKTQIDTLGQGMSEKVKQLGYWLGLVALLGIFGVVLGIVVRKKLASSSDQLENNLARMRTRMEEENVKLDSKLVELLQSQMKLVQEQSNSPAAVSAVEIEVDHSLALRVGAEILRLRQRFKNLPEGTKGIKPLFKSLERLEDEFNQKGYEMVEMLGKPFDERLNVKARFIPSDDLALGENIIGKVIKPQINFNGVSIQVAEIEVLTGGE